MQAKKDDDKARLIAESRVRLFKALALIKSARDTAHNYDFAEWCKEAIEDISAALEELAEEETDLAPD